MKPNRTQVLYLAVLATIIVFLAASTPAYATGREKVLYQFYGANELVHHLCGKLTADAAGNLYGVGCSADNNYNGLIYRLKPGAKDKWTEEVIYNFTGGSDGSGPNPDLVFDAAGNLYGAANQGGDYGAGTIFELSPTPNGTWTETTLYSFGGPLNDGIFPGSGLILDAAGNLYGGTMFGGNWQDNHCYNGINNTGCGTIFKMTHNPDGTWTESILYSLLFIDGWEIFSGLTLDAAGNLYGMATWGGTGSPNLCIAGCGTVFQLAPQPDGSYMFHRLYSFQGGTDGAYPVRDGHLLMDSNGNLYGATTFGGSWSFYCSSEYNGCGTAFQLTPQPNGTWNESVLHAFGNEDAGIYSMSFTAAGVLAGVTGAGGAYNGGTFFELKPGSKGQWKYKDLYDFGSAYGDALNPEGPLTLGADGNFYGLSWLVGAYGTMYRIKP